MARIYQRKAFIDRYNGEDEEGYIEYLHQGLQLLSLDQLRADRDYYFRMLFEVEEDISGLAGIFGRRLAVIGIELLRRAKQESEGGESDE